MTSDAVARSVELLANAHAAPYPVRHGERNLAIREAASLIAASMRYNADDSARSLLRAIYRDLGAAIDEVDAVNARAVADATARRAALLDEAEAS